MRTFLFYCLISLCTFVNAEELTKAEKVRQASAKINRASESKPVGPSWRILGFDTQPSMDDFKRRYREFTLLLHSDRTNLIEELTPIDIVEAQKALVEINLAYKQFKTENVSFENFHQWEPLDGNSEYSYVFEDDLATYYFGQTQGGQTLTKAVPKNVIKVKFKETGRYKFLMAWLSAAAALGHRNDTYYDQVQELLRQGETEVVDIDKSNIVEISMRSLTYQIQFSQFVSKTQNQTSVPLCFQVLNINSKE